MAFHAYESFSVSSCPSLTRTSWPIQPPEVPEQDPEAELRSKTIRWSRSRSLFLQLLLKPELNIW